MIDGLAPDQIKRPRISGIRLNLRRYIISIMILVLRFLEKCFAAADFFNTELIRTETNSTQEFVLSSFLAFHKRCARSHHLVKHQIPRDGIANNQVAQDVWRPVAPVIPNVRRPVAAVGEAPDGGGFGDEGGWGEI